MNAKLLCRLIGLSAFAIAGARIGAVLPPVDGLGANEMSQMAAGLGAVLGFMVMPVVAGLPLRRVQSIEAPRLMLSLFGGLVGLCLALLLAYPLSLLGDPLGRYLPALASLLLGWLGIEIFAMRAAEIGDWVSALLGRQRRLQPYATRQLLLDTSVLIDGRIVEIAETGFIGGTLVIPRFVLGELQRVADSADPLRRNRGRRGLAKLTELQRENDLPVKIVDDDPPDFSDVDDKLVALSIQLKAALVTNDFNLNQVAEAQGVDVLNINALANAVRSVYIPGETFEIRIIQAGRDANQGVGYLDDGTMVVVESGQRFMGQRIGVEVTKLINRPTGRMIFAAPQAKSGR